MQAASLGAGASASTSTSARTAPQRIRQLHPRRALRRIASMPRAAAKAPSRTSGKAKPIPPPLPANAPATASARPPSSASSGAASGAELFRLLLLARRRSLRASAGRSGGGDRCGRAAIRAETIQRSRASSRRGPRAATTGSACRVCAGLVLAWPPAGPAGRSPPAPGTISRYSSTPELPGGATTWSSSWASAAGAYNAGDEEAREDDDDELHSPVIRRAPRSADASVSGLRRNSVLADMAQAVAQRLSLPAAAAGRTASDGRRVGLGLRPCDCARLPGRRLRRDRPQPGRYRCVVDPRARLPRRARSRRPFPRAGRSWPRGCSPRSASGAGSASRRSESPERTLSEVARIATYLGVLLLGLFTLDRRRAPAALLGVASAIALVAGLAVLSRLQPELFPANETGAFLATAQFRLNWPLNYWNGLAALCALGVPLALALAAGHRSRRRPRAQRRRAAGPRAVHRPDHLARWDPGLRRRRRGPPLRRSASRPRDPGVARRSAASRARSSSPPPRNAGSCTRTFASAAALQQGDELTAGAARGRSGGRASCRRESRCWSRSGTGSVRRGGDRAGRRAGGFAGSSRW